jgi:hypothetical protein
VTAFPRVLAKWWVAGATIGVVADEATTTAQSALRVDDAVVMAVGVREVLNVPGQATVSWSHAKASAHPATEICTRPTFGAVGQPAIHPGMCGPTVLDRECVGVAQSRALLRLRARPRRRDAPKPNTGQ